MQTTTGKSPFYTRFLTPIQALGHRLWEGANKLTRNYVSYLAQAINNFITKGTTEAVVFGYWSVFSLFPLVMLAIVVASFALGPESAKAQISRDARSIHSRWWEHAHSGQYRAGHFAARIIWRHRHCRPAVRRSRTFYEPAMEPEPHFPG